MKNRPWNLWWEIVKKNKKYNSDSFFILRKRTLKATIHLFNVWTTDVKTTLFEKLNIGYFLFYNISRHQLLQKPILIFVKIDNISILEASFHSEQFLFPLCLLVVIFSFVILLRYLTEGGSLADNSQTSLHYFWWDFHWRIILLPWRLLKLRVKFSWNAVLVSLELLYAD